MKELGNRISVCRQNRNMTQEELANKIGVTPQAVSKWERGLGTPDILCFRSLCNILEVSADYLLGTEKKSENSTGLLSEEISKNIANSLESLELIFGGDLVPLFLDGGYQADIEQLRRKLSKEGIILPIMRIRDEVTIKPQEFMILAYRNVLYAEEVVKPVDVAYILQKVEQIIRERYYEILSPDIVKQLLEQIRLTRPALVEGIVPEKLSYALLTKVTQQFLRRGNGIQYLPKIIESMQYYFLENDVLDMKLLCDYVARQIEREDNFYVYIAKRYDTKK